MIVVGYRISKQAHAGTIWSGDGAQLVGGRWNSPGVAMVYASQSLSLAALEQLVHLRIPRGLSGYVAGAIAFEDWQAQRVALDDLPAGWDGNPPPAALQQLGDQWIASADTVALVAPSAITTGEWNYLFNPGHPDFAGLHKWPVDPFNYDSRLT